MFSKDVSWDILWGFVYSEGDLGQGLPSWDLWMTVSDPDSLQLFSAAPVSSQGLCQQAIVFFDDIVQGLGEDSHTGATERSSVAEKAHVLPRHDAHAN